MRFSVFTASMLAGSAAAYPWRSFPNKECSASTVTVTVTAAAAASDSYNFPTTPVAAPTTTAVVSVVPSGTTAAPVVTTSAAAGNGDLSADASAALAAHNSARADVGNAALTWDTSLVAAAQEWANNLASTGKFEHSGVDGQGENLYMQSGSDNPLTNAVNAFLSEKSSYHGEVIDSSNYMTFGHYTQCVWKSTTAVGMASAKGSDGNVYVVARYTPPGNYIGEKPY